MKNSKQVAWIACAALSVLSGHVASAQSPTKPPASSATSQPRYEASQVDPQAGTSTLGPAFENVTDPVGSALRFFNPAVNYTLRYGDGISTQPGRRVKSTVHELAPSASFQFAERFMVSYSPSFTWYTSKALEDRSSHRASIMVGGELAGVDVGLSQGYSRSSVPLVETGEQTDQESWNTSLNLSKDIMERSSLEVGINQNIRSASRFTDVISWSSMVWFRHKFITGLDVSAGLGGNYSSIDPGADIYSWQAKGGLNWSPGTRLRLGLTAGVDVSQFRGPGRGSVANPIYGGSAQYQLFEPTSISLGVSRSVSTSFFADEFSENSRYSLGVSQRLLGRLNLGAGVSLSEVDYVGRRESVARPQRSDKRWSYSLQLGGRITDRLSSSVGWQRSESDSSFQEFTYGSSTWSFSLGWRF